MKAASNTYRSLSSKKAELPIGNNRERMRSSFSIWLGSSVFLVRL
jgi:hypothetical protein